MRRGAVVVKGIRTDGSIGDVDVLDLDDDSFRSFVLDQLAIGRILPSSPVDLSSSPAFTYKQRMPPGHPRTK